MAITVENLVSTWGARFRASPAARFLVWWKAELSELLPQRWRDRLVHEGRQILISRDEDKFRVWSGSGDSPALEFSSGQDTGLVSQQFAELQHDEGSDDPEVVLLINPADVLRSTAVLPLAAERNLRQALSYDLDRQTPFAASDVFFDYAVTERNRETGQIYLDLFVVPREHVQTMLATLGNAGVGVHRIDMTDGAVSGGAAKLLGLNLLPPGERAKRQYRRLRFNIMLALAVLLVTALVMAQSLYIRGNQVAAMEDALEVIRQEARLVANLELQYQESMAAARFLGTLRADQAYLVDLLADVTRVIPDNTYLQRITVKDDLIRLQGLSDAAQRLLTHLNESKMLINASFETSQINVDARTGKERFNVSATIVPLKREAPPSDAAAVPVDPGQGDQSRNSENEDTGAGQALVTREQNDETATG
jgi:general secretion pathway protein L